MNIHTGHLITGDPAFAVDRNGIVVLWNEASEQTFGYTEAEALGRKCWDLMCGHDLNGNRYCFEHCPLIEMAFLHEPVHAFKSSFDTSSHEQKQFSVSCVTVYDKPGDEMLLHICHPEQGIPAEAHHADPSPARAAAPHMQQEALSQRELEVLQMLADGVSTCEVARRLSISARTVRTHIQHLMYKLQVHNRRDAILAGRRLKLI